MFSRTGGGPREPPNGGCRLNGRTAQLAPEFSHLVFDLFKLLLVAYDCGLESSGIKLLRHRLTDYKFVNVKARYTIFLF